jgi:hypothetical protein|nr:hypothetical protein [Neorhizobium tomejilense]
MVFVVDELKGKLAEVNARLVAIREEAAALEGQRDSFEIVISVYDPSFSTASAPKRRKTDRSTPAKRITDMLKGKDLRGGILITLRDADTPLRATDIAHRFIAREGLESEAEGLSAGLSGRFSTMLDRLAKDGLIRSSEDEGRHRIWEIAR